MSIIDVARQYHFPPSVIARVIIENVTEFPLPTQKSQTINNQAMDDRIDIDDEQELAVDSSSSAIRNDSMTDCVPDTAPFIDLEGSAKPTFSISNAKQSSLDSSTSSYTSSTKKSSYQKKVIRSALHDPLTILGDSTVIRPIYQSTLSLSIDPSYSLHKLDTFTGLPTASLTRNLGHTTKLALDVWEALEHDPMYGPRHDRMSTIVGIEYELALEELLYSMSTFALTSTLF